MSIILNDHKISIGLAGQIAADLRLRIVAGELGDGEKLSENALATQFGSSRGPVREALKILEYEGLVSLTKQGVIVHGLTVRELDQLYDVRYMLEQYCLTHISQDLIAALVQKLEVYADRMALALKHRDFEEFARQDILFHNTPFELLDHKFVNQFWTNINSLYQTVLYVGTKRRFEQGDFAYKEDVVQKHRALVEVLGSGNRSMIEKVLRELLSRNSWIEKSEF
jgi:GntR family transcriptional regulator, gluconate operon transcriptional repressor